MFNFKDAIIRKKNEIVKGVKDFIYPNGGKYILPSVNEAFAINVNKSNKLNPVPKPPMPNLYSEATPSATPIPLPTYTPAPTPTIKPIMSPQMPMPAPTSVATQQPFPNELSSVSSPQFLDLLNYIATQSAQYDIPIQYPMGQAGHETGFGKKGTITGDKQNWFGLGATTGKSEEDALTFGSPQESFDYYAKMISRNPRYAKAYANRHDEDKFFDELAKVPYATDKEYKNLIKGNRAYRYGKSIKK